MMLRRFLIHWFIPKGFQRFILSFYAGWHGYYEDFRLARMKSGTYNDPRIFAGTLNKIIADIKNGNIVERDGGVISEPVFQTPILIGLVLALTKKNSGLYILDFGGGLGSTYRTVQNYIPISNWVVVEQQGLVDAVKTRLNSNNLHFFDNLREAYKFTPLYDLLILSSVLQYLENPYVDLRNLLNKKSKIIVVDRTLFSKDDKRYVSIQKVPANIYGFRTSYPCWTLNKNEFLEIFKEYGYILVGEFKDNIDETNRSDEEFLGFVFKYEK